MDIRTEAALLLQKQRRLSLLSERGVLVGLLGRRGAVRRSTALALPGDDEGWVLVDYRYGAPEVREFPSVIHLADHALRAFRKQLKPLVRAHRYQLLFPNGSSLEWGQARPLAKSA